MKRKKANCSSNKDIDFRPKQASTTKYNSMNLELLCQNFPEKTVVDLHSCKALRACWKVKEQKASLKTCLDSGSHEYNGKQEHDQRLFVSYLSMAKAASVDDINISPKNLNGFIFIFSSEFYLPVSPILSIRLPSNLVQGSLHQNCQLHRLTTTTLKRRDVQKG